MNIKDLENYCIKEGIKNIARANSSGSSEEKEFFKGRVNAFFWIAACIQNNSLEEKRCHEKNYKK